MAYLDNRLNIYETYTYNIRLYMVNPINLSKFDGAIDDGSAILLMDNSTETQFNINSVEQVYAIGYNVVRETVSNKFSMVVREPNGATLLSKIVTTARQLNIHNHIYAGYFLVIDFHGRKEDGLAHKFDQEFLYPLVLQRMDIKITAGGGDYILEFVENSATGHHYLNNVINEVITIEAQTVGEFVRKFQAKYNDSIINVWKANPNAGRYHDVYKFEFDENTKDWGRWQFQAIAEPFTAGGANFTGKSDENPNLQVVIHNGSNITTIFGQVLQLTAEYKRIIALQNDFSTNTFRKEPSGEVDLTLDAFPTFFKIITNVEYGDYDEFSGQYAKIITYKLKAYVVTDEIIDNVSYQRGITDPKIQSQRIDNLVAHNFLRKKYDFLYTGANTEVIDFDLQFNQAYFYVLPYGDGYYGDPNVQSPRISGDVAEVVGRFRDVVKKARTKLGTAQQSLNHVNVDTTGVDVGIIRTLERSVQRLFKEYNDIYDDNLKELHEDFNLTPEEIDFQLRFIPDVVSDSDLASSDNDTRSGALKFGAIKANLENSADLLTIELYIRGDPYWLGAPNSLYNKEHNVDDVVDYEAGSTSFFLKVNFPTVSEDGHGRRKPQPDYQMSGLYTVRTVISKYEGGQFTQYLGAVRDTATNVSTVWAQLFGDRKVIQGAETARIKAAARDLAAEQEAAYRRVSGTGGIQ